MDKVEQKPEPDPVVASVEGAVQNITALRSWLEILQAIGGIPPQQATDLTTQVDKVYSGLQATTAYQKWTEATSKY